MAHNSTLNYGGVTPAMAVFGILPRGFYDDEAAGLLASAGALQTDLTTFEKALRIRQMSLYQQFSKPLWRTEQHEPIAREHIDLTFPVWCQELQKLSFIVRSKVTLVGVVLQNF